MVRSSRHVRFLLALSVMGVLMGVSRGSGSVTQIEFLGEARIPAGLEFERTVVGGLSGITFDEDRGVYYVVSDDPSGRYPARFYTVEIDLANGRLAASDVRVTDMTVIQDPAGGPMEKLTVDPEGIALLDDKTLYISSEGQAKRGVALFVRRFSVGGVFQEELSLADRYTPDRTGERGPRHNFGFESLTLTPDGQTLFTALENALIQDGPAAALDRPSPTRLLEFDVGSGRLRAEYLYLTEPLAAPSPLPDGLEVAGLVELLALDDTHLLSLERSFSMGPGNAVSLFQISTGGATDLSSRPALMDIDLGEIEPVRKEPVLDLLELGVYLDNVEGMTFGPDLPDGRRVLILVSDDNFNAAIQTTQFLALALDWDPIDVGRVQGASHRSPLEGRWIRGLQAVVTGVREADDLRLWMEDSPDDGDPDTSRGIQVGHSAGTLELEVGDKVEVSGRVRERQRPGDLGVTWIESSRIEVIERGRPLPPPIQLDGADSRVPSEVVDDDGLQHFEPQFDGLDYWESLEGMRVVVTDPRVIGPTTRYGEVDIDASSEEAAAARTSAGGLLLRPGDLNPERLTLELPEAWGEPQVDVGAEIVGDLQGIVDYAYGRYRLHVLSPLPTVRAPERKLVRTDLRSGADRLTVATFNVLNLSAREPQQRFDALAGAVIDSLGSPDILALQEIQDDSGRIDDGTVSAHQTLGRLMAAIAARGGPRYDSLQIDPQDNRDGGQPGANIRVAYLFLPDRVHLVERGEAGPNDSVRVLDGDESAVISLSPGRLQPLAPAFAGDEERGFSPSRKPLVAEFRFGTQRLILINNHWASKRGDDPTFGEHQPPIRHTEDQRSQQARLVAEFVRHIHQRDAQAGVIVLGDLNDHEFRSPLRVLTGAGLDNQILRVPQNRRYTFNFNGNSQVLDYILVSRTLLERAEARVQIVHCNADTAHARASSDHDPVVLQLAFRRPR